MSKISIIVPVYNVELYLRKCIDSLVNQTYKNIEIILVNDGSIDNSGKICDEYARANKEIKVLHKKNEGVSAARNTGISKSTGEYIMFVDSDDWIDLDTCEILINKGQQANADIVLSSYYREYEDMSYQKHVFKGEKIFNEKDVRYKLLRRFFGLYGAELANPENADSLVVVWAKLYKKDIITGIMFEDLKKIGTAEDQLFNIQVFLNCKKALYIDKCLYHWRKTNNYSITSVPKNNLYDKWKCLYDEMRSLIDTSGLESMFYTALNNRICLSMIGLGLNEVANKNNTFFIKRNNLQEILKDEKYINAYKKFSFKYLPMHWKLFFVFCKLRQSTLLLITLLIMQKLRKYVK